MPFEFIFPMTRLPMYAVAGALVLAAAAWGLRFFERRRARRLDRFIEARLAPRLLLGPDARARKPLFWMPLLGAAFLLVTLAQPHWGQAWQEVHQRSHDVLVLLDTSESMRAENPLPNRLERAKQKIVSILEKTPGDRFGLIAFSGAAELMCPLTLDDGYFKAVLNAVDTDSISLEGTDIASALDRAVEVFKTQEEETGDYSRETRAVGLISDGEALSGDGIEAAGKAAKYAHVFVIGVGDPEGTEVTWGSEVDHRMGLTPGGAGQTHVSKLDEATLERIALEGEGGYVRASAGNDDVDEVYGMVSQLSARSVSSDIRLRLVNRFQWPLALAILCFAAEGIWLVVMPRLRKAAPDEEAEYA